MRSLLLLAFVFSTGICRGENPASDLPVFAMPEGFPTLVNPNCSHCRDEARLRASELRDDDRVLCWIRGYSNGGAIPHRFFLNSYRVISDSYGVFVYDSDAGFARGFAPSFEFSFYGWRNGVMLMKRADGTLFSCLTGFAIEGPGKGTRLEPVATLASDWGFWLKHYPDAVAYRMFDKYKPVQLSADANENSVRSRPLPDPRRMVDELVLGVWTGASAKAYPFAELAKQGFITDRIDGDPIVVLWEPTTKTAAAYRPIASQPRKFSAPKPDKFGVSPSDQGILLPPESRELAARSVTLQRSGDLPETPFIDQETGSRWDVSGRAVTGELKDWTLTWADSTQVKWFAWAAEHPETSIYESNAVTADYKPLSDRGLDIAPPLGNLDATSRHFAILKEIDSTHQRVSLLMDGKSEPEQWDLIPDAEVRYSGWWGRLDQFTRGDRVWVWFKKNSSGQPLAVSLLADELSEQDLYGPATVSRVDSQESGPTTVTLEMSRGGKPVARTIRLADAGILRDNRTARHETLKVGEQIYVQTTGDDARLIYSPAAFEIRRAAQKSGLRLRWINEGLPGTLIFSRPERHEIDVMLDHEALHWGRSLRVGDRVTLRNMALPEVSAVVKQLQPWRERTQILFEVSDSDSAESTIGQRVSVQILAPPTSDNQQPPALDRHRTRLERVEWLMSSFYCTCGMHDVCAGHFYSLAACDAVGKTPCGLAKNTRARIGDRIDSGQTDRQIVDELLTERGPNLLRPHMSQ